MGWCDHPILNCQVLCVRLREVPQTPRARPLGDCAAAGLSACLRAAVASPRPTACLSDDFVVCAGSADPLRRPRPQGGHLALAVKATCVVLAALALGPGARPAAGAGASPPTARARPWGRSGRRVTSGRCHDPMRRVDAAEPWLPPAAATVAAGGICPPLRGSPRGGRSLPRAPPVRTRVAYQMYANSIPSQTDY